MDNALNASLDEYTLAAYVAGTLAEDRRAAVAAWIAEDPEAQELLRMAHESLEAARLGDLTDATHNPLVLEP